jgi:hypothetical protein
VFGAKTQAGLRSSVNAITSQLVLNTYSRELFVKIFQLTPEVPSVGGVFCGVGNGSIIGQKSFQGMALAKTDLGQGSLIPIN